MKKLFPVLLLPVLLCTAAPEGMTKIQALSNEDVCYRALKTETDPVVRKCAFRKLIYTPASAEKAMKYGLKDKDPAIRALSLYEHFMKYGPEKTLPLMKQMAKDPAQETGVVIAELSSAVPSQETRTELLRTLLKYTSSSQVKQAASRSIGFNFYRNNKALSEDPANDHDVTCLKKIPLPVADWAFTPDRDETGHLGRTPFFAPSFNDRAWKRIRVDKEWESQGFPNYDGIGWYRKKFFMPAEPKGNAYELCFGAVDENAYVWLNGVYIGQHAIGAEGWNIPFRFDVTKELIRGGENVLAVRVQDQEMAGGIWRPVHIEIMKAVEN